MNSRKQRRIRRIKIEAEIATEEAALEQEKLGFIEKEKELQSMQHAFNELVQYGSEVKRMKKILRHSDCNI